MILVEATPSKKRRLSGQEDPDDKRLSGQEDPDDKDSSSDVEIIPDDSSIKKEEEESPLKETGKSDSDNNGPDTSKDESEKEGSKEDSDSPGSSKPDSSDSRHDEAPRQRERPTFVDLVAKQIDSIFSLVEKR